MKQMVFVAFFFLIFSSCCFAQRGRDSAGTKKIQVKTGHDDVHAAPVDKSADKEREFKDQLVNDFSVPELEAGSHDPKTMTGTDFKKLCKDPYGICKKKIPMGNDFKKIIPPSVCKWKRIYFKAPTPLFDGEARFTNGRDSVFMLFSLQRDSASCNSVFKTIKNEAIESNNLIAKEEPPADPAWLKIGRQQHVFFAWTRTNYIFSCESLQGWNAVKDFMKCFPY